MIVQNKKRHTLFAEYCNSVVPFVGSVPVGNTF